jgi:hypothetical protein
MSLLRYAKAPVEFPSLLRARALLYRAHLYSGWIIGLVAGLNRIELAIESYNKSGD